MFMADEGNYRESRWFNCWTRPGEIDDHPLPAFMHDLQRTVPFGDAVLDFADTTVAVEICEELFVPMSPHLSLALAGNVEIFLNGSASHHEIGKLKRRFNLILGATAKVILGLFLFFKFNWNFRWEDYICIPIRWDVMEIGSTSTDLPWFH
jgi:NAD+ synthase (glutamine-hydrolysing)